MATATLNQVRSNLPTGFKVDNNITNNIDIPKELFVYSAIDDKFSHVATLFDFTHPTTNTPGFDYYRQDNAAKEYEDVESALEFANHVKFRVDTLLTIYTADMVDFPGSDAFPLPETP